MNYCEMAYCLSYALGHPRIVGVSACHVFGGLTQNLYQKIVLRIALESCPTVHIGGCTMTVSESCPTIHLGGLSTKLIIGVCPLYMRRRVVHKVNK